MKNNLNTAVELVIFDMDGLMLDTEPVSKAAWARALDERGYKMHDDLYSGLLGRNITTANELMNKYYGEDFEFEPVRKLRGKYVDEHHEKNGVAMKKGLLYILDRLDQLGIKKCVATSTNWDRMEKMLREIKVFDRFDGIITGDKVKLGKPHPEAFLSAAKLVNIDPANCIVLEDSYAGVEAAYLAGMRPIMIPDMLQPDSVALSRIFAQCADLQEAAEVIAGLVGK